MIGVLLLRGDAGGTVDMKVSWAREVEAGCGDLGDIPLQTQDL